MSKKLLCGCLINKLEDGTFINPCNNPCKKHKNNYARVVIANE